MRPLPTPQTKRQEAGARRKRNSAEVVLLPQRAQDESQLVRGLINREPASISQLFDQYSDVARGTMIRTLGSTADVDDLVQETFMIVIDKARELRKSHALRSFVVSVAIRLAKNALRKRAVRRFVRWSELPAPVVVRDCSVEDRALVTAVYRVLDQLDANSRVLFVMRHVEGWELKELAEVEHCSLATLKRRLQKAERRFRAIATREPELRELGEAP